ncbi:hypothetical protein [Olivibacter domesticus]|uniref:Uncharacterized protein n=1 Tax=Olivibacter domesticus TaxID=407022 RepID=A0A1H7Q863_OLID1|nr:hypothetical protein [Olivibacter domesticus]SEL44351.1 hypothetical protein SAMN05661044_02504 [Olivibacter domesticus]
MTTKKIMGIIALVIVGGIGFLIFIIYATVKTKSTNLNKYEPFKEWIGQTVLLTRETVLFEEKLRSNENSQYPYTLLDSLHPKWQYAQEQKNIGDIEEIVKFPACTTLKLENAIQYTNGVSGSSYPTIFGTITVNGNTYKTGYQWGTMDIGKSFDKIEKCWQFNQAPWQDVQDTTFYALPTANFW